MTHQMNPLGLSGDFIGGRLKMKRKRIVGVVLALAVVFSCFTVPAFAQENLREEPLTLERRASGRFSITVKAGDVRKADTSFPLEKGDTVRIKASYAPADATIKLWVNRTLDNQFYYYSRFYGGD